VNNSSTQVAIIDITTPTSPVTLSTLGSFANPLDIYVQGRYAYVADGNNVKVVDVSNPASPVIVSSLASVALSNITGQGTLLYGVSNGGVLFDIIDASNPLKLVLKSSTATGLSSPNRVDVQGRYAYITDSTNGLVIYDVATSTSPTQLSTFSSVEMNSPSGISVRGRYAYVSGLNSKTLNIIDVSNPATPVSVASVRGMSRPNDVFVQGRYAYIADINGGGFVTIDLGGAYIQQLETGGLETGSLAVRNNISAVDATLRGGLAVGSNLAVGGSFSLNASTFNATSSAFQNHSIFTIGTASSSASIFNTLYNGSVGIGSTTPAANLVVQKSYGYSGANIFQVASSTSSTGNTLSSFLSVSSTGFGTTTLSGLNISGSATSTSNVGFNITSGCYAVNGTCITGGSGSGTVNSGTQGQFAFYNANGTAVSGTSTLFMNTSTGLIGIGTTTPRTQLTIAGGANAGIHLGNFFSAGSGYSAISLNNLADGINYNFLSGNNSTDLALYINRPSGAAINFKEAHGISQMVILPGGNIGIGTTTPQSKLEVTDSSSATTTPFSVSNFNSATSSTSVGIGFRTGDASQNTGTTTASISSVLMQNFGTGKGDLVFSTLNSGAVTEAMRVTSAGFLGVGTTSATTKLAVSQTTANPQFAIGYNSARDFQMRVDSAGGLNAHASNNNIYMVNDNLWVCTGGSNTTNACPSGAPTGQGNLIVQNKVGIGTSTPQRALTIANGSISILQLERPSNAASNYSMITFSTGGVEKFYAGMDADTQAGVNNFGLYDVQNSATVPAMQITGGTGNVEFGTTTAQVTGVTVQNKLYVGNGFPATAGIATSTFVGDLRITGKLDVPTIDPVYTIDGTKYATYGHSTIGIHEEVLKTVDLSEQDPSTGKYSYTIEFPTLDLGTDLWLFYNVTDFGDSWKNLVVSLTPSFDGTVFYKKLPGENKLVIMADQPGEVSMRLSANRFDYLKWPLLRPDQHDKSYPGFEIDSKNVQAAAAAATQ
jgi:hypothetical protein